MDGLVQERRNSIAHALELQHCNDCKVNPCEPWWVFFRKYTMFEYTDVPLQDNRVSFDIQVLRIGFFLSRWELYLTCNLVQLSELTSYSAKQNTIILGTYHITVNILCETTQRYWEVWMVYTHKMLVVVGISMYSIILPVINLFLHIDRIVQERRKSSALAMELHLCCTKPSVYTHKMLVLVGLACVP